MPVLVAWTACAWLLGTYRPPAFTTMVATWAIAVPAGIMVRAMITGRLDDDRFWVFLGVAMAFTLLFLGVGRALAIAIVRPWRSA